MCDPLSLGVAATAGGSAAGAASTLFTLQSVAAVGAGLVNYVGAKNQADAQEDANRVAFQSAQDQATKEAISTYNTQNARLDQQRRASSIEIRRVVQQSLVAASTARTSAAKGGVAGAAIGSLIRDFERKEQEFRTGTDRNLQFQEQQTELNKQGAFRRARGRVLAAVPDPVRQPSFLGTALRTGGAVLKSFGDNTFLDGEGNRHFGVLPARSQP